MFFFVGWWWVDIDDKFIYYSYIVLCRLVLDELCMCDSIVDFLFNGDNFYFVVDMGSGVLGILDDEDSLLNLFS